MYGRPLPFPSLTYTKSNVVVMSLSCGSAQSRRDRAGCQSPGHAHGHGGRQEGDGLVADAVQPDLRRGLVSLQR